MLRGRERITEEALNAYIDREADRYFKKYRRYVEAVERDAHWKKFKSVTSYDVYCLGKMLENVDGLIKMCEANGTVADLGLIPRIARDVVTIAYGVSPIPLIASVQPLDEEVGIIYYKAVKAVSAGGNISRGAVIASALGDWTTPEGFAVAEVTEKIGTGDGSRTTFAAVLTYKPIRPGKVVVIAGAVSGSDFNQDGKILGDGVSGTINYETGAISLTFTTAPASGVTVNVTYWANVEDISLGVREINYELVSKMVNAKIYALKGVTGLFKAYQMQKRFGRSAEEEIAIDLVNALNSEMLGDVVRKLNAAAPSTVTWSITAPSGVSYFEHKQTIKDAISGCERKIIENAKRGTISYIIAGSGVASVLRTLFGWETVYEGYGMATGHLFGNLDGVPVIRITDTSVLDASVAIVGYKGPGAFEAAIAFCPYMPITVTSVLPTASPIVTQRAAAAWVAIEVLVNNFVCKLSVTGTYPYS